MFKSAIRAAPRRALPSRTLLQNCSRRRLINTAPPSSQKSRSWKNSAARWAAAAGGIYYYNTSNLFAEEPTETIQKVDESLHHIQESSHSTIDAVVEEKRKREAQHAADYRARKAAAERAAQSEGQEDVEDEEDEGGLGGLEEEADQQGAFNPETGEINWDCPCLGGMAHGPCGDEFKAAFSCFVYSDQEPKGVECIEKFKGMQDCFRQHPEIYGAELEEDEDEVEEELRAREQASAPTDGPTESTPAPASSTPKITQEAPSTEQKVAKAKEPVESHRESVEAASTEAKKGGDEGGDLVSKAAHDAS
ncbi:hypothetical protein BJ875DRAFT_452838 [Amylocarpus encephaloides]|uniref:Mitochondrial intermembrane space import and assembly protein 40 n=1 Tax=Amylocarpus encephaloides TaxID=45428 RepID=A0A9P8C8W9_9HELO|nr:hypothetical protein BJ875DRAFT_452838 [Amylocarpus encephaloides]